MRQLVRQSPLFSEITGQTIIISSVWLCALILSLYSGFHTHPVPADLAWQFSPLGLLHGVQPEYARIESRSLFAGTFGPTFDYLRYFLKTVALEAPFYFLCLRDYRWLTRIVLLSVANLATHPFVFFVFPMFFRSYLAASLTSEAFAAIAEMVIVGVFIARTGPCGWRDAVRASVWILVANLFSWEVGMFL